MSETAITRRKVVAEIGRGLAEAGYSDVFGPVPCGAVFFRRIDDLVLTFGVEFSQIRPEHYTGSFYLSRSFTWSTIFPGFPRAAFERLGPFLPTEQRHDVLVPEYAKPGIVEAWFLGFRVNSAHSLAVAAKRAEPGFLAQPGLADAVRGCAALGDHMTLVRAVQQAVRGLSDEPTGLLAQPKRPPIDVPPRWLWAAELVLAEKRPDLRNAQSVAFFATDAWRLTVL